MTTKDRFTVQDETTGFLESFARFKYALDFAHRNLTDHPKISIFDRMARCGARQLWEWNGQAFICTKQRDYDDPVPMCYGCGERKAVRLSVMTAVCDEPACYCSVTCAAKDAVEHVMCEFDWCEKHRQWYNTNEGCSFCDIGTVGK